MNCVHCMLFSTDNTLCIRVFHGILYHLPSTANRGFAKILRFQLTCGQIGHAVLAVARKHIACKGFGKQFCLCKYQKLLYCISITRMR